MTSERYADDLSYRERVVLTERDQGTEFEKLAERFEVSPERIGQIEGQARQLLASLPLTGRRLEDFVDSVIERARSSDAPNLSIRAEVMRPYRLLAGGKDQ